MQHKYSEDVEARAAAIEGSGPEHSKLLKSGLDHAGKNNGRSRKLRPRVAGLAALVLCALAYVFVVLPAKSSRKQAPKAQARSPLPSDRVSVPKQLKELSLFAETLSTEELQRDGLPVVEEGGPKTVLDRPFHSAKHLSVPDVFNDSFFDILKQDPEVKDACQLCLDGTCFSFLEGGGGIRNLGELSEWNYPSIGSDDPEALALLANVTVSRELGKVGFGGRKAHKTQIGEWIYNRLGGSVNHQTAETCSKPDGYPASWQNRDKSLNLIPPPKCHFQPGHPKAGELDCQLWHPLNADYGCKVPPRVRVDKRQGRPDRKKFSAKTPHSIRILIEKRPVAERCGVMAEMAMRAFPMEQMLFRQDGDSKMMDRARANLREMYSLVHMGGAAIIIDLERYTPTGVKGDAMAGTVTEISGYATTLRPNGPFNLLFRGWIGADAPKGTTIPRPCQSKLLEKLPPGLPIFFHGASPEFQVFQGLEHPQGGRWSNHVNAFNSHSGISVAFGQTSSGVRMKGSYPVPFNMGHASKLFLDKDFVHHADPIAAEHFYPGSFDDSKLQGLLLQCVLPAIGPLIRQRLPPPTHDKIVRNPKKIPDVFAQKPKSRPTERYVPTPEDEKEAEELKAKRIAAGAWKKKASAGSGELLPLPADDDVKNMLETISDDEESSSDPE